MKKPSKLFVIILVVALLAGALVAVVFVGNPQWHKWIYIAQMKIYGEQPAMPDGFTGVWNSWSKDGMRSREEFLNGELHGRSVQWWPSGRKCHETEHDHGRPVGVHTSYHDSGSLASPDVHATWGYTPTGMIIDMFRPSGQRWSHVVINKQDRTKVIQNWDTNGVSTGTRTLTWDENNNILTDETVRPEGASNQTLHPTK